MNKEKLYSDDIEDWIPENGYLEKNQEYYTKNDPLNGIDEIDAGC